MVNFLLDDELLKTICISEGDIVRTALQVLSDTGVQITLIIDKDGKLVGTVTDGDIRRGLLKGKELDEPITAIMNPSPRRLEEGAEPASIIEYMRTQDIQHLPIIDEKGCLIRLHMIRPVNQHKVSDIPVVIMAGGLGSRLRPLTDNCPKPMLELGKKPILERILVSLVAQGFTNYYFSVNYLADVIENYFGDGRRWGVKIQYLYEPKKLGTAGALGAIEEMIDTPIIVQNGDLITDLNYCDMVDAHIKGGYSATMGVRRIQTNVPYGVVQTNEDGVISGFAEKPNIEHNINAGIYCLSPKAHKNIEKDTYLDMPTLFEALSDANDLCSAYQIVGTWLDIGTPDELARAQTYFTDDDADPVFSAENKGNVTVMARHK